MELVFSNSLNRDWAFEIFVKLLKQPATPSRKTLPGGDGKTAEPIPTTDEFVRKPSFVLDFVETKITTQSNGVIHVADNENELSVEELLDLMWMESTSDKYQIDTKTFSKQIKTPRNCINFNEDWLYDIKMFGDHTLNILPPQLKHIIITSIQSLVALTNAYITILKHSFHYEVTVPEFREYLQNQLVCKEHHYLIYRRILLALGEPTVDYTNNANLSILGELLSSFNLFTAPIQVKVYFLMLCDRVLQAPMFQVIQYAAFSGCFPHFSTFCKRAMKDDLLHYGINRLRASEFVAKIDAKFAQDMTVKFTSNIVLMFYNLIGVYDDGFYNFEHVSKHIMHTYHYFMTENSIYTSPEEYKTANLFYSKSPAFYVN